MGLFGKSQQKDPKEQVREWNSKLRKEQFQLDRQIRAIKREEDKVTKSLKDAAKKNDKEVCILLAKQIVTSRKAINRIHTSKAQINSIMMGMSHQVSTLKLAGSLQKSTEVMKSMQNLVKVPEVANTMQELSKEMMKAGIIEEMMEDTLEGLDNSEDIEEEAQEEVDKVLWELTAGTLGKAPVAVSGDVLPAAGAEAAAATSGTALAESDDEEVEAMKERLEALRS